MNEKEQQIISQLRKDARSSLASISYQIGMPISTIYDKINRLQRDQVITKFIVLVDFAKLGYNYRAKIALKIDREQKDKLLMFLKNQTAVNSIQEIDNGFDYLIDVIHKDVKEYQEWLERLQREFKITELHQYQVVRELERERLS